MRKLVEKNKKTEGGILGMKYKWKKTMAALLTASMVLSLSPTLALAEDGECNHIHNADCGYVEAEDEIPCDMECEAGEDGVVIHGEGCAYAPAVEGVECGHVHDENCGGLAEEEPAAGKAEGIMKEETKTEVPFEEEDKKEEKISSEIADMQERINALPSVEEYEEMDADEQDAVYATAAELSDEYFELTEEEQGQLDITKMELLFAAMNGGIAAYAEESDKINISSVAELEAFRDNVNNGTDYADKTVLLTADLNLGEIDDWTPIGTDSNTFKGTFDGQNHVIYNLTIDTDRRYCGLFGKLQNSTIRNLGLENVNVVSTNNNDVAGLAGNAQGGMIERCYVTGSVKGMGAVSGILGSTYSSSDPTTIKNCYTRVALKNTGNTKDIAGISGWNEATSVRIENCYSACVGEVRPIAGWSDKDAVQNNQFVSTYFDNTLSPDFSDTNGRADLGRTSEELQTKSTFVDWDFDNIWVIEDRINGGYPYLRGFTPGLGGAPGSVLITVQDQDGNPVTNVTVAIKNDDTSTDMRLGHQGNGVYSGTVYNTGETTYEICVNEEKVGEVTQTGSAAATKTVTISVQTITHTHSWEYTAKDNEVTAKCMEESNPCKYHNSGLTLTLRAEDMEYSGKAYDKATISGEDTWSAEGLAIPTIQYAGEDGTSLDAAPTNVGRYKAKITIGDVTAEDEFKITIIDQAAPAAPTEAGKTSTTVTVSAITASGFGEVQYACNTENTVPETGWQADTIFSDLEKGTTYYFFARYVGDQNHNPAASGGTAIKTVDVFTVTFNAKGGTLNGADNVQTEEGTKIAKPADPTRSKYRFQGWFKDEALQQAWDFEEDAVTEDMTLYAGWKKKSSGSNSGGSSTSATSESKTDTETKPDGTETTTETKPDGTEIKTETKPGGTETTTETKPDGTKTVTETKPDGTETTTVTDPDGGQKYTQEKDNGVKVEAEVTPDGKVTGSISVPSSAEGEKNWIAIPAGDGNVVISTLPDGTQKPVEYGIVMDGVAYVLARENADIHIETREGLFDDMLGHWAEESSDFAAGREILKGIENRIFSPEQVLTRGMMVSVLYRMEQKPAAASHTFIDVNEKMYYNSAVAWATETGIASGYDEVTFGPEDAITREQMAAMLYQYAEICGYELSNGKKVTFADEANISPWAREAMDWAVDTGILSGRTGGIADPQGKTTRAEASAILERFIRNVVEKQG